MITASKLAGFFAAHAIWSVSEGDALIPMLAYTREIDDRTMERFVGEDLAQGVAEGKRKLQSNVMDADDAALVYDGLITIRREKVDAIIVEMRAYFSPESEAIIAVPYTPGSKEVFRVHRPKLLVWKYCDDFGTEDVIHSFFDGVAEHEAGSKVWSECLDESK